MYDESLRAILAEAVGRLEQELEQYAPLMAAPVRAWLYHLAGAHEPGLYFQHPTAFPMLLLPWWLERSLRQGVDVAFQASLVYSTLNGYYYIRLIDNIMDQDSSTEVSLLPAAGFFHTEFQGAYLAYFAADHPFWTLFRSVWACSAEAALQDARSGAIDAQHFAQFAARKVCAAKIPLGAVCYHYERADLIEPWSVFVDRLGGWHQMWNDLFDWHKDLTHGNPTFFLSEAERQRQPEESVAAWVVREGFEWGCAILQQQMAELKQQAHALQSPELERYLAEREGMTASQQAMVRDGFKSLAKLAALLR